MNAGRLEIRKTNPADNFDEISSIYALSWKSAYRGIVPGDYLDELPLTQWSKALTTSDWESYVLLLNGRYIATSSICPARDESMPGWGEIISIYVLPEYFGQGYGKKLLDAVTDRLRALGYNSIYLWVLRDNHNARNFYVRNGFSPSGDTMTVNVGGKALTEMRYIKTY